MKNSKSTFSILFLTVFSFGFLGSLQADNETLRLESNISNNLWDGLLEMQLLRDETSVHPIINRLVFAMNSTALFDKFDLVLIDGKPTVADVTVRLDLKNGEPTQEELDRGTSGSHYRSLRWNYNFVKNQLRITTKVPIGLTCPKAVNKEWPVGFQLTEVSVFVSFLNKDGAGTQIMFFTPHLVK